MTPKHFHHWLRTLLIGLQLAAGPALSAAPAFFNVFAPAESRTTLNGNSEFRPFDTAGGAARFQQAYNSGLFAGLPPEGGFITGFRFRVDAIAGHSFDSTIPSVQLNLSTTSRPVDGLSAVFSENEGNNDTLLIGPGSLFIGGAGGGGSTGFDVTFDFHTNPFYYNQADGNLLVDFRIFQGFGPVPTPQGIAILDAFNLLGDSVSSLYGLGTAGLPTSGQPSTLGLATAFFVVPVPEPSTWALFVLGVAAFVVGRRKFTKRKEVSDDAR